MSTGQNILADQSTSRQLLFAAVGADDKSIKHPMLGQAAQQAQLDYALQYNASNQQQISSTLFIMDC